MVVSAIFLPILRGVTVVSLLFMDRMPYCALKLILRVNRPEHTLDFRPVRKICHSRLNTCDHFACGQWGRVDIERLSYGCYGCDVESDRPRR